MKILISAYACEPHAGSEPGAGWNWVLAAAQDHDVWVITRANNRDAIERTAASELRSVRFEYVELPRWVRWCKRGRVALRLYYMVWQFVAGRTARRLHREHGFDVVHHLTFANLWLPALVWRADAPFLLGPVGGGSSVPRRLYPVLGAPGALAELLRIAFRRLSALNPLVRSGWRRASVILVQNAETLHRLPARHRSKARIRPHASVNGDIALLRSHSRGHDDLVAVYGGRLLPWKGVSLAIRALVHAPAWRLVVVGRGHDRRRLVRLAERQGVSGRVEFVPWLSRQEFWDRLGAARVLVLPSLRDDSPLVAAEAQVLGIPVIAFDQGGPAILARRPGACFELVELAGRKDCVLGLAAALQRVELDAATPEQPDFGIEGIARDLDVLYREATRGTRGLDR